MKEPPNFLNILQTRVVPNSISQTEIGLGSDDMTHM
jgi:hypothetical protein